MLGIGNTELVLIVLFAFLMFGPDKLPGMGRTIGRALRQFRTAQEGVTKVVQSEIIDPIQNVAATPAGKAAAEAALEDADLPEEEAAPSKPKETFAERRVRLAAERAASQAEDGQGTEAAPATPLPADSDVEPENEEAVEAAAPAPASVAALYGLDDDEALEACTAPSASGDDDDADIDAAPDAAADGKDA